MTVINLGNLKFTWKGDWAQSTAYNKDDIVKYGPSVWVCVDAHTSASTFAANSAKFEVMAEGLESAGTWNNSTLYKKGQTVVYGGAVYVALRENTNANPYTSASDWLKFVDGQQFEGDYNTGTNYQKGDIVYYGGYLYVAKQNALNNNPTDTVYWDIYVKGFNWQGTWQNITQYAPGDIVAYGGNRYIVKEGQRPLGQSPTNTTFYQLLVQGFNFRGDYSSIQVYVLGDIVKYGGKSYICIGETQAGETPDNVAKFSILSEGTRWRGAWSSSEDYIVGDLVSYGGSVYIAKVTFDNDDSSDTTPGITDLWTKFTSGMKWEGTYSAGTTYKIDDVVEYAQSSYISLVNYNIGNTPSSGAPYWNLVAQGDSNAVITTRGDILTRDATQAVRLPIGPAGSFLTSNGTDITWGHLTPQNDYYVSPQGDDTNDGRTPTTSWKTIKHACAQTFSLGQCRINVSAGTYTEQCPIRVGRSVVLEGNGLGAVTISPDTTNDNGFGVGISDDGSTPNANSYVFHMNNGSRMRNFVFRNFSTGSVLVSLDPGYGPDDTSVWITSQSPYVQNCTSFTPGGTGFKIDGALHNGGYKSMVANDWTQINSDGIGIHALNDGRTELVSCFTYYCDIGYLAESGAKIRAIVGNNSYGEYGAVARGFSQAETPLTGKLRLNNTTINSVQQIASNIHVFTSYRDEVGNRFYVGHTNPTGTDVTSTYDNTASYPVIMKLNSAGALDWIYTYESSFGAIHSAIELGGRIYCGGVIYDGSNKGFILSISKAGEIQWQKTIGDTSEISDLAVSNTDLYAVGNHVSDGVSVIKLNIAGIQQWARTLSYNDSSASATLTSPTCTFAGAPTTSVDTYALAGDATAENNLYVAAYDSTNNQTTVTRLNDSGAIVTGYQYGDVRVNKLRLDTGNGDGIYLMAAGYYDAGAVNKNPLLFRLSVDGTVQWQKQIANGSEEGEWKDVLPFGNEVYVSGYMNEGTNNNNAGFVARYTSNGNKTWSNKIDNGTNNISLNGVALDGVNVALGGIDQGNSIVVNIQRDDPDTLGTVTSGSYASTQLSVVETNNTVVVKQIEPVSVTAVSLGTVDTTLTLNQTPSITRTVVASRPGFAGIGTGTLFNIDELGRKPKEGSVLTIDGDTETYFVIAVNNFIDGDSTNDGTCGIVIDPAIPSNKTPNDQTDVIFREAYSQVRMTGHDFLDIGTGGFADTNYPVIIAEDYSQQPDQLKETLSEQGGRVFYVTTDQDGNFRVGDYFKVEQSTGRATLSSEEFDLTGLNELQLGSITAGKQGATINEFSTDGTFADNSDESVPTEKATKTYVDNQISIATAGQGTIVAGSAPTQSKVEVIGSGASTDTVDVDIAGTQVAQIGDQYILVPKGTTAERPGTPADGYFRYNTTIGAFEGYVNGAWSGVGGGNPWITKVYADSGYTALNNDRIFVDTTSGTMSVNLPATPNVGDNVRLVDVAGNFANANLTIVRNGSNIMGLAENMVVDQNHSALKLTYSGSTYGWVLTEVN